MAPGTLARIMAFVAQPYSKCGHVHPAPKSPLSEVIGAARPRTLFRTVDGALTREELRASEPSAATAASCPARLGRRDRDASLSARINLRWACGFSSLAASPCACFGGWQPTNT